MNKYRVYSIDYESPIEIEADYYEIFDGSYERKSATFYDAAGNILASAPEGNRLFIVPWTDLDD